MRRTVLLAIASLLLLSSCSQTQVEQDSFSIGSNVYLYGKPEASFVADSRETLIELEKARAANDSFGSKQMILSGQIIVVTNGTKVLILDSYANVAYKIRILEGEHQNVAGWTDAAWLRKSKD